MNLRAANPSALLLFPALLCGPGLHGQILGQSDERAVRIVEEAVAALGGDKFLNMEDRVEEGRAYSFYRERLNGLSVAKIYTRYITVARGKTGEDLGVRERQSFGKNEDSSVVFREDGGWDVSYRGVKPLDEDRIERYRETTFHNVFYILKVRRGEEGMIFESRGSDVIENQPVEIVDIVDADNRVVTVYFHKSTKLPLRQVWVWRDPKTRDRFEETTRFGRYREVNGVMWPTQMLRERDGEKIYEIFAENVTINQDLTDDVFAIPEDKNKKR